MRAKALIFYKNAYKFMHFVHKNGLDVRDRHVQSSDLSSI